ncbi:MAG TPA: 2-phosphosulfolactate phosphatase [Daejeonella sp.]|nr:2-phosphosulfolactate phosphatase [Daejeonella sp.]
MQARKLEVCLTPALLHLYDIRESIVVVIDIFRATSSICYGIENGAEAIIPVASIESCESYRGSDFLLAAERNGEVVDGFDFGNSPFAYTKEKVGGKTIVLTTTNGTHAINESRQAHKIVIGSFLNLAALCNWLKDQEQNVFLLCAGWKDKVNLEDSLFAGAVVHHLNPYGYKLDDSGIAAADLYRLAQDDLSTYLQKTSHSERLKKLNIEEDIEFCLNVNLTTAIPVLEGDRLVKIV